MIGLICRRSSYPSAGEEALRALAPALLEVREVSEWPGSRLGAGLTTSLRLFRYDSEVKGVLLMFADSVLDWHNPNLPDDPHLLRRDGSTWLTSSTVDEGEVVLSLTSAEFERLRRMHPNVAAAVQPGLVVMPEDL